MLKPKPPLCGMCSLAQFGPWMMLGPGVSESNVRGCRRLTERLWSEGLRDDADVNGWFQKNCPLIGIAIICDEELVN